MRPYHRSHLRTVGVSDPYERPASPDVAVRTDLGSPEACELAVVAALRARGLIEDG